MPNPLDYLRSMKPVASHPQNPDPNKAWRGATGIGAPGVNRPLPPDESNEPLMKWGSIGDVLGGIGLDPLSNADPSGLSAAAPIAGSKVSDAAYGAVKGIKGLYSRLTDAMSQLPNKVHPVKAMSQAKNMASGEEISYRGLDKFLQGKGNEMVHKDDILSQIAEHPIDLEVKTYGGSKPSIAMDDLKLAFYRRYGREPFANNELYDPDIFSNLSMDLGKWSPPKYPSYTVPGSKENYGETLIKVPEQPAGEYIDPHWRDDPNVVVHSRYSDRTLRTPSDREIATQQALDKQRGTIWDDSASRQLLNDVLQKEQLANPPSKGRFIEEIQGQWHQDARKLGYKQPMDPAIAAKEEAYLDRLNEIDQKLISIDDIFFEAETIPDLLPQAERNNLLAEREQLDALYNQIRNEMEAQGFINPNPLGIPEGPPDAPFKDSYPDLALKQQILNVVDNPDLNWIGINSSEGIKTMGMGTPERGSQKYYDEVYPNKLKKLLTPFGGKVERAELPNNTRYFPGDLSIGPNENPYSKSIYGGGTEVLASTIPGHSSWDLLDQMKKQAVKLPYRVPGIPFTKAVLTPEMKRAIKEKGFPAMALLGLLEAGRSHERTQ